VVDGAEAADANVTADAMSEMPSAFAAARRFTSSGLFGPFFAISMLAAANSAFAIVLAGAEALPPLNETFFAAFTL